MLYDFKYDGFFSLKLKFHQGSLPRGANYKYYYLFFSYSKHQESKWIFPANNSGLPRSFMFYLYALDFILLVLDTNIAILVHLGNSLFFRH